MSGNLSKRVSELERLLSLFESIETHLRYRQTPTAELIAAMAASEQYRVFTFLPLCAKRLSAGADFPTAWRDSLSASAWDMHLQGGDLDILRSLSDVLGATDTQGQLSALDLASELLRQNLKEAVHKKHTLGKLYRSLGVLVGIGAAIMIG